MSASIAGSLPQVLQARARTDNQRSFLIDRDGEITYGQAWQRVQNACAELADLGVRRGTVVATLLPGSVDAVVLWVALAAIGAVEAPLNTALHGELLYRALNELGADLLVVDGDAADRVTATLDQPRRLPSMFVVPREGIGRRQATALPLVELAPHDPACVMITSGTTGPSKAVVVPWRQLHETAWSLLAEPPGPDDCAYIPAPLFHVGGKGPIYLTALTGGRAVLRPSFRTGDFWPDVIRHGCTVTYLGAAMANFLLDAGIPERGAHRLRDVLMVPVIPRLNEFRTRLGVRVCTAYNMTELSCPIVSGWLGTYQGSSGRVRPGWQARIVDEHDRAVPDGVVGELMVRPDQPWTMFSGYLGRPEETAKAWRNLWFHTGDSFRSEGNEFTFVDRLKDVIRRRGENISSAEVEELACRHPAVAECAAIAVASTVGEEEVLLLVRRVPETDVDPRELHTYFGSVMPRFMVPRYIDFVADFPRTPNSKVRKAQLRAAGLTPAAWDARTSP